jgi:hypothetical protein
MARTLTLAIKKSRSGKPGGAVSQLHFPRVKTGVNRHKRHSGIEMKRKQASVKVLAIYFSA